MKIAFINRDRETSHKGGDLIQIAELTSELQKLGVEISYFNGDSLPAGNFLEPFDLVNVFHSNFQFSLFGVRAAVAQGKPYVLTPIFFTSVFGIEWEDVRWAVNNAAYLLPNSPREIATIETVLGMYLLTRSIRAIPNGTSARFHCRRPFEDRPIDILTMAQRGGKGDDMIEELAAAERFSYSSPKDIPHNRLQDCYAECKVFVHASSSEVMSLVIGEALCAGCRVLATAHNPGNSWYGPGLRIIDPGDKEGVRQAMKDALASKEWDYSPNEAARKLTWESAAAQYLQVYKQCLNLA